MLVPYPSVLHLFFLNLVRPALILTGVCSVASSALEKNTSSSKFAKTHTVLCKYWGKEANGSEGFGWGKNPNHKPYNSYLEPQDCFGKAPLSSLPLFLLNNEINCWF